MHSVELTELVVAVPGGSLNADLETPPNACGLVVLPRSTSSSRSAARSDSVARTLHENGLATLTVHLLLPLEAAREVGEHDAMPDRGILCDRLQHAYRHAQKLGASSPLSLAFCGVGAEAALALWAAAFESDGVRAVASLGGRPDLVPGEVLARVRAATLLVLDGADPYVVDVTRAAARQLRAAHRVAIVPRTTHAFAETEFVERAARHAAYWFSHSFGTPTYRPPIGEEARVE